MKYSLKIIKRQRFSFVLPIFRNINDIRLSATPRNPLVLRSCRYGIIVHRKSFYITSFVWLTGNLFRKDWRIHHALVIQANSTTLETFKIWRKLTQTKNKFHFITCLGLKGRVSLRPSPWLHKSFAQKCVLKLAEVSVKISEWGNLQPRQMDTSVADILMPLQKKNLKHLQGIE